jgi:hypothetical protein
MPADPLRKSWLARSTSFPAASRRDYYGDSPRAQENLTGTKVYRLGALAAAEDRRRAAGATGEAASAYNAPVIGWRRSRFMRFLSGATAPKLIQPRRKRQLPVGLLIYRLLPR